jgi:hypothetical protein
VKGFVGIQAPHLVLNKPRLVPGVGGAGTFTTHAAKVIMSGFAGLQVSGKSTFKSCVGF